MEENKFKALLQLCSVYSRLGNHHALSTLIEEILACPESKDNPNLRKVLLRQLLLSYSRLGRVWELLSAAERLLEESQEKSDQIWALEVLSDKYSELGDWGKTKHATEKLLSLLDEAPRMCIALFRLATACEKLGLREEAEQHLQTLLERETEPTRRAMVQGLLASFVFMDGKLDRSLSLYHEAAERLQPPLRWVAITNAAHIYALQGNMEKALAELGKMPANVEIDAQALAPVLAAQQSIFALAGRIKEAEEAVTNLLRLDPQNNSFLKAIVGLAQARQHLDRGAIAAALAAAEEALDAAIKAEAKGIESEALVLITRLYLAKGDLDKADRTIEAAIKILPQVGRLQEPPTLLALATLRTRQGALREAHRTFNQAREVAREMGVKSMECQALLERSTELHFRSLSEAMCEDLEEGLTIALKCEYKVYEALFTGLLGVFYFHKGENGLAQSYLEDSIKQFEVMGYHGPARSMIEEVWAKLQGW